VCFDCSSYFFPEVSKFDVMSAHGLIITMDVMAKAVKKMKVDDDNDKRIDGTTCRASSLHDVTYFR